MHSLFSVSAYALYVYQAAWDLKGGFGAVGDPWCWDRRGKRQIFFFFLHVVLSLSLFFLNRRSKGSTQERIEDYSLRLLLLQSKYLRKVMLLFQITLNCEENYQVVF